MEELEFLKSLLSEEMWAKLASISFASRLFFKPFCSWWTKYVSEYISIRPTELAMNHPLYRGITYLLDWFLSVKLPQLKNPSWEQNK